MGLSWARTRLPIFVLLSSLCLGPALAQHCQEHGLPAEGSALLGLRHDHASSPAGGSSGDEDEGPQKARQDDGSWDVGGTFGPVHTIEFSTDQGTWMNLDVHPSGELIVFDLLGDLYTLPLSGGEATRITHGAAYDFQPRFSPKGDRLLFTSDRGGGPSCITWGSPCRS